MEGFAYDFNDGPGGTARIPGTWDIIHTYFRIYPQRENSYVFLQNIVSALRITCLQEDDSRFRLRSR